MRARRAFTETWPAPVSGLLRTGSYVDAPRTGADVLDNFICTDQGARLRGGAAEFNDVEAPVIRLLTYQSGANEKLFAATASKIIDVTTEGVATDQVTGLGSGDWSHTQFGTAGGEFLVAVNGQDDLRLYDGSTWKALNDSSTPAFTGVNTSDLTFAWMHKSRLWFCEKNHLSAWYLPANSIAGAAVEFPLNSVFSLGGSLVLGGSWSTDSGDGMDDFQVFVTSEGEVAIYRGTDPDSANTWSLVGVYRIGRPLNKNAWFRSGGDFMIATEDGIISIGAAMQMDRMALQGAAITAPINDLWGLTVTNRVGSWPFATVIWPSRRLLIVSVPSVEGFPICFAANTTTGGWSRITGWDARAFAVLRDKLFFGNADGKIARADAGGNDLGQPYAGYYVPKFQEFGSSQTKVALHARATWRSAVPVNVRLTAFSNYAIGDFPQFPASGQEDTAKWGAGGKWGQALRWGGVNIRQAGSDWQTVWGSGFAIAPGLVVGSNRQTELKFEITSIRLRFEMGREI